MKKPESPPSRNITTQEEREKVFSIIESPELLSKIFNIEKDYPYWEKFKQKSKHLNVTPSTLWKFAKIQRDRNTYRLKISDVQGFEFKYNSSAGKIQERLHQFDLHLGGILKGNKIIPDTDKERFLISSLMEEAIASSQLEGAATTREVAKNMLRAKRKPKNHSEKMILNNYLTIQEIIKVKNEPLSPTLIKKLHSIITKDTLESNSQEGEYRTNNDVKVVDHITGEIFYTPPCHTELEKLIEQLCDFANSLNDKGFIHPIIRGIILHFIIGYIHPFVDGNGRTARAIFYWYLISKGYWLIEYMSISRIIIKSPSQYAKAYLHTEYDENDLTYFIDFNLKSMDLALKSLKEYISRKLNEKKQLTQLILKDDFNERQAEIIKDLINDNIISITINEVQGKFGTVYQTARVDLLKLEEMGYIMSKTVGKKLIFFKSDQFDEKIKKITQQGI